MSRNDIASTSKQCIENDTTTSGHQEWDRGSDSTVYILIKKYAVHVFNLTIEKDCSASKKRMIWRIGIATVVFVEDKESAPKILL